MKCQKCSKPATYHITELVKHTPTEVHLCELHAHEYLSQAESEQSPTTAAGMLAQYLASGAVAELARRQKKSCPVCGITYLDFRNHQRLGCPHDYDVFREELLPLLESIHGETEHCGKVPKRAPGDSKRQAELIKLRNDLKRAIAEEAYEDAAHLRDQIRELEQ